ncbi:cytochrome d ubiquinol oxidase subunit II [Streptomyces sp. NPDC001848]|uniref:cytochrome d ubiquinol oxidase subunit II n=1 Tax=Streptomyces sp. NPDC001848 TaxID=3364618 RepID=UPI0036BCF620
MDVFWYALVGLLLAGYLALESLDFGTGLLFLTVREERDRERLRRGVVPLFLANEVWLVAFTGLLLGALPGLESGLLHGLRSYLLVLLTAWFLRDAALWFRTAHPGDRWRRGWDAVLPAASLVLAAGWGLVLATLIRGLSTDGRGQAVGTLGDALHPLALLCAALTVVASLRQGALHACRAQPDGAVRHRLTRLARRLAVALAPLVLLAAVLGGLDGGDLPATAVLGALAAACVYVSERAAAAGMFGRALVWGTVPLLALPVTVGLVHGTTVLATRSGVGAVALADAVANSASLTLLTVTVLPALVAVALGQVWMWRVFGGTGRPPS